MSKNFAVNPSQPFIPIVKTIDNVFVHSVTMMTEACRRETERLSSLDRAHPTVSFGVATFIPGSAGHSWQNVAAGGSTIGTKGLINAAKVFSLSAIELFNNPKLLQEARKEFDEARGKDFKYESLLGDRKPALDYRVKK